MSDAQYTEKFDHYKKKHQDYWAEKKTEVNLDRYRDGFARGWDENKKNWDKEQGKINEGQADWWAKSRIDAHANDPEEKERTWEFKHAYKQGFEAYTEAKSS